MPLSKRFYNSSFAAFLLGIFLLFFFFRPLNSPWFRIIGGDGHGYYSYLPATFVYNDKDLSFQWFNREFPKYYGDSGFETPEDIFVTGYQGRHINKYYPGLSFLWLPFFGTAHVISKLAGFPADGYSVLYQVFIGLAAVCYTCLGLFFLRKLLLKLFQNEAVALFVPVFVFFGTSLYDYCIFFNSMTHSYSFTWIVMSWYYAYEYLNQPQNKSRSLLFFLFCMAVTVFIRPLNVLSVLTVPVFATRNSKLTFSIREFRLHDLLPLFLLVSACVYCWRILYIQTGSFIPYTYTNEGFHLSASHLMELLASYQAGIFLYTPLLLVALAGCWYFVPRRKGWMMITLFFTILFIYSCWWYWRMTSRALVDYAGISAILLAALLSGLWTQKKTRAVLITLVLCCIGYFQLKSMQFRNGILHPFYTDAHYYWTNFFVTYPVNIYPVPERYILQEESVTNDFEQTTDEPVSRDIAYGGKQSLVLDASHPFSKAINLRLPGWFGKPGLRKVKTTFRVQCREAIASLQLVYSFHPCKDSSWAYVPFYINGGNIRPNTWDLKEFGLDLPMFITAKDSVSIFLWNNEAKGKAYIDDLKVQFILADSKMEAER